MEIKIIENLNDSYQPNQQKPKKKKEEDKKSEKKVSAYANLPIGTSTSLFDVRV